MDRNDWNATYAAQDLVWGAEPNRFLAAAFAEVVPRGSALDLACGEGRNAIWLARRGWEVTAVDYSEVAVVRARNLAAEQGVTVNWIQDDVTVLKPPSGAFQLIIITYLQVPGGDRRRVLGHAASALAPGGELFMVGHARRNLAEGVGGPRHPEVLWDGDEIAAELAARGLAVELVEYVRRPVETPDGVKDAIDTLVRARQPLAAHRRTRSGPGRPQAQ